MIVLKLITVLVIIIMILVSVSKAKLSWLQSENLTSFVSDYFYLKNIGVLYLFSCSFKDDYLLFKIFNAQKKFLIRKKLSSLQDVGWNTYKIGIIGDSDCDSNLNLLAESSHFSLFNESFSWLVWASSLDHIRRLSSIKFTLSSDFKVVSNDVIYDVYKLLRTDSLQVDKIGKWNNIELSVKGLNQHRTNLHNITIKAGFVLTRLKINSSEPGFENKILNASFLHEEDQMNRFVYSILSNFPHMFNYTQEVNITNTWGYKRVNGTYIEGLMAMFDVRSIEHSLSPFMPRSERVDSLDFLTCMHGYRISFVFRQPTTLGTTTALSMPFSMQAWAALGLVVCICSVIFWIISKWSPSSKEEENSLGAAIFLTLAVLSQEGFPYNVEHGWTRFIGFFFLVQSVMILAYYNAAIMDALLSPAPNTINSIDQLMNGPLKIGVIDIPYLRDKHTSLIFMTQKVYDSFQKDKIILPAPEAIQKVRKERFAFYAQDTISYAEIERQFSDTEKCDLSEIHAIGNLRIAPANSKKSPLRDIFNQGILKMMEAGLINRMGNVWYNRKPACLGGQSLWYVSLEAITVAVVIFLLGFVASIALLGFERVSYNMLLNR